MRAYTDDNDAIYCSYQLRLPDTGDWYFIEGAYAKGESLDFRLHSRKVTEVDSTEELATSIGNAISSAIGGSGTSRSNYFYLVESFTFAIPMANAIEASCNDTSDDTGLKIALIGDYRKDIVISRSLLQGFLLKSKDKNVLDVEGNCFDLVDDEMD